MKRKMLKSTILAVTTLSMKRKILCATVLAVTTLIACVVYSSAEQTEPAASRRVSMELYSSHVHTQQDPGKAEVNIVAPDRAKIGDLITIDLSASIGAGFDYEVYPKPPGLRTFDDKRVIVCGTGNKNITYTFVISCALDGDSDVAIHKIKIYGAQESGPSPDPGQNIVEKVGEWASDVQSPNKYDDAIKLAQSFSSIAIIIDQDAFDSPRALIEATATSNRDALGDNVKHWAPLLNRLMVELKATAGLGLLPDAKSHSRIWKDVAQGLREYADKIK